jgi:hypothetical protein
METKTCHLHQVEYLPHRNCPMCEDEEAARLESARSDADSVREQRACSPSRVAVAGYMRNRQALVKALTELNPYNEPHHTKRIWISEELRHIDNLVGGLLAKENEKLSHSAPPTGAIDPSL